MTCIAGTSSAITAAFCTDCEAGFSSPSNAASCTACPESQVCPAAFSSCFTCPADHSPLPDLSALARGHAGGNPRGSGADTNRPDARDRAGSLPAGRGCDRDCRVLVQGPRLRLRVRGRETDHGRVAWRPGHLWARLCGRGQRERERGHLLHERKLRRDKLGGRELQLEDRVRRGAGQRFGRWGEERVVAVAGTNGRRTSS